MIIIADNKNYLDSKIEGIPKFIISNKLKPDIDEYDNVFMNTSLMPYEIYYSQLLGGVITEKKFKKKYTKQLYEPDIHDLLLIMMMCYTSNNSMALCSHRKEGSLHLEIILKILVDEYGVNPKDIVSFDKFKSKDVDKCRVSDKGKKTLAKAMKIRQSELAITESLEQDVSFDDDDEEDDEMYDCMIDNMPKAKKKHKKDKDKKKDKIKITLK